MNWLELSPEEVMAIATPIMDNLMQASTDIDHAKHVRDFSANMKSIVTPENLESQCREYQKTLGFFTDREMVGVFRRKRDAKVFWRQRYSKSEDEFIAFLHLMENRGRIEVVNVSVS